MTPAGLSLLDRRHFLATLGTGLPGMALANLLASGKPHFEPKAKRVVSIFCSGACSHLDTFDYKPELIKRHGQPMPGVKGLVTFQGENGSLTRSPYTFRQRGKCGKWTSDLLPEIGNCVDDLCFLHALTSKSNTHGPAEAFMNTGFTLEGFPSAGSWVSYALGSESRDLPAFVAIPDPRGIPQIGPANWSSGFLPAVYQGTAFTADRAIANLVPPAKFANSEAATRDFLALLNKEHLERHPGDTDLAARISAYELAGRMQLSAPAVSDLSRESAATRKLYGLDDKNTLVAGFGRNCLLARRLLEQGVRFVQLFNGAYAMGEGVGNWDGHKTLKKQYDVHGPILDRGVAALLKDLKSRGMMDDTLVLWTTEFGRMPTFQKGAQGRDHNPKGFTAWMAGAGVKRGYSHGATDEFGHEAVEKKTTVHDFHATVLHLLGLDHQRLSFYHNGIERRLTDVHGHLIREVLA